MELKENCRVWPIDIAAGDHGEIRLDTGPDGSARIPELANSMTKAVVM
jgi:hypothetical protein